MTHPEGPGGPSPAERREGFLMGAAVGAGLAAATFHCLDAEAVRTTLDPAGEPVVLPPPAGRRRSATALGDALLVELMSGGVDLHLLAGRWVEWLGVDGFEVDPVLAEALSHLRDFDAPAPALSAAGISPIAAALPAALAGSSPKAMIAGAFHVARMLDPSEETALSAVAVVVAASILLEGQRDFVADVVAVLRANGAGTRLVDAVRSVPKDPRTPPPVPRGANPEPVAATTWLLWIAHHRPRGQEELAAMALACRVAPSVGAALGALVGARDGLANWPQQWIDGAGEEGILRRAAARRL